MKKYHFIHIPKNGGMTIRRSQLMGNIATSTPGSHISPEYTKALHEQMAKYYEHHGNEHARWRDLNKEAQGRKCFAIVRNPWSKVVSRYTFLMSMFNPSHGSYNKMVNHPTYEPKSFEEFLEERHVWGDKEFFWHRAIRGWYCQVDHVSDFDGNIKCDILRLENLNEDVNKYFNTNINLRSRNVSNVDKKDYRDFYTPETKKIIEDWYADDIETFGFTFDGPATKNIWNKK
jgi:hypothetical protein